MTDQYDSEFQLFELTPEPVLDFELLGKTQGKRNSFGPRLPIRSADRSQVHRRSKSDIMAPKDKGKGTSGNQEEGSRAGSSFGDVGGTVLGMAGFKPKESLSAVFVGTNQDGVVVEMNVFEAVFKDGLEARNLEKLLNYLHASGKLDFSTFIEGVIYQGFDRDYYIRESLKKVSVSVFCRFAILGAVRGSNFKKISETCVSMPADLTSLVNSGVIVKRAVRRQDMTILRFTASIPHWVAFWLFTQGISKKIESEECPGWLQFPGAASLPMSKLVRLQHISFCIAFSSLLPGGEFNKNIYYTAYTNRIPAKDIPKLIKDGLGIGENAGPAITDEEVRESTSKALTRVPR